MAQCLIRTHAAMPIGTTHHVILCTTNPTTDANGLSLLHPSATTITWSLAQSFLNAPSTARFACSRSPQVISTTTEWGFSQSVVYAGWCSCSPCLTCSQSPTRVVCQSCGWNGTSHWLASQKSRSLSIGLLSMRTVKQKVYRQGPPASLQQLRNRITDAFNEIRCTREVRRAVRQMETRAQRCVNLQGGRVDGRAGLQWVLSYNMICLTKPNGSFQSQQSPNDPFQGHQKTKEKRKTLSHALLKWNIWSKCTVVGQKCFYVPWEYINVCGYSDQFCKIPHTRYILRTYFIHTTYRMSDHIVSFWTKFRRDNKLLTLLNS